LKFSNVLKSLKYKGDVLLYDFKITIDESNKLKHSIWVFSDSIQVYDPFDNAVVFDTIYRIKYYNMLHNFWVWINNHENLIYTFFLLYCEIEKIYLFTYIINKNSYSFKVLLLHYF